MINHSVQRGSFDQNDGEIVLPHLLHEAKNFSCKTSEDRDAIIFDYGTSIYDRNVQLVIQSVPDNIITVAVASEQPLNQSVSGSSKVSSDDFEVEFQQRFRSNFPFPSAGW